MKTAVNRSGKRIDADGAENDRAFCPYCGGVVVLRRRRVMGGEPVAYWRHQDNRDTACPGRSSRVTAGTEKNRTGEATGKAIPRLTGR